MANNPNAAANLKPFVKGDPRRINKPKGVKHIATWINEMLNDESFTTMIHEGIEVKQYKGAPIKAIMRAQAIMAVNGDTKAADLLFRHATPQKLLLGNDPDNPLVLTNQLTDEELNARLEQIISKRQGGSDGHNIGTGSSAGS